MRRPSPPSLRRRILILAASMLLGAAVLLMTFISDYANRAADQALDGVQRVLGVGDRLALGRGADQHFAAVLVSHDGRRGARAFGVLDHAGRVAFHDGHAAVGGAEVNADDSSHDA